MLLKKADSEVPSPAGQGWPNNNKTTFAWIFHLQSIFSGVGEALGWPSGFLAGRSPPALGWFHPPSKFTIVIAYGVNKGPFMQLFPIPLACIPFAPPPPSRKSTLGVCHSALKRGPRALREGEWLGPNGGNFPLSHTL